MHRIATIDVHVAGEPLRVVTGGFPDPPGKTLLEKRRGVRERYDHFRRALMWEPRGHADMYGCLLVPPTAPQADLGVLFFHNEGYSTMCGHGVIGLVTVVLENGILPAVEPETIVRIETPSGLVTARATVQGKRVRSVAFQNVPSFVAALDQEVKVPGMGPIRYDLAFGGAYYAFCRAEEAGVALHPAASRRLIDIGMAIKNAVSASRSVVHPLEPELSFLYGTIFVGPPQTPGADSRHACIFADGALDRSPTGTGLSARLPLLQARGALRDLQPYVVESLLGTRFTGRILKRVEYGAVPAVIPEVEGCAYSTGRHEFLIDPDDPLRSGFLLQDSRESLGTGP